MPLWVRPGCHGVNKTWRTKLAQIGCIGVTSVLGELSEKIGNLVLQRWWIAFELLEQTLDALALAYVCLEMTNVPDELFIGRALRKTVSIATLPFAAMTRLGLRRG